MFKKAAIDLTEKGLCVNTRRREKRKNSSMNYFCFHKTQAEAFVL